MKVQFEALRKPWRGGGPDADPITVYAASTEVPSFNATQGGSKWRRTASARRSFSGDRRDAQDLKRYRKL